PNPLTDRGPRWNDATRPAHPAAMTSSMVISSYRQVQSKTVHSSEDRHIDRRQADSAAALDVAAGPPGHHPCGPAVISPATARYFPAAMLDCARERCCDG